MMVLPKPPLRLPRRKRMTLIAAWRCQDGIVVHADTQESVPVWQGVDAAGNDIYVGYRKTVLKIEPRQTGHYNFILAGGGNASLIESFIVCLERRLAVESGDTLLEFVTLFEDEMQRFVDNEMVS
jgi:hypothetical protein